ncbi:hypothetical protein DACRYDRAFT_86951 [Dacryopinax primogenitus]|uniref:Uncharacterized protein n=1 Tax=Dacryopinax primogenitus (strain DJM 731) TaxID=1858805 RepID=M5GG12_DACPD|nr:uncharacterized protein DACRYDRAFT_86951 [Dacryopinax primogenitus]EJU04683.1 hypothetical protein DACRYDRAFT_86951 [Dacryopinax primogenitus]
MDPNKSDWQIVDMTEEELVALDFLGENAHEEVKDIVNTATAVPKYLSIDCLRRNVTRQPEPPTSPTLETLFSQLISNSDARTVVAPDMISEYEKTFYYHGISGHPPELMWRSDFESNPFPIPPIGTTFDKIPQKTINGVFNTPLNAVWDTVAPQILASMKARGLKYSSLMTARFSIVEEDKETRGPIVIWIAVHPNTTNVAAVRDATLDILDILTRAQIIGVVVEWYEGSIGSPNTKFCHSNPVNTGWSMLIARQTDDPQVIPPSLFKR